MFIGSGLEAVTNFTSLMSENMREDQAIQLIAFYGNQLVSKKEEKVVKQQIAQVQGKTQPLKQEQRSRVQSIQSVAASAHAKIRPKAFESQEGEASFIQDSIQVKRNYNAEKMRLMQTVQKVQTKIAKPGYQDPYPLAKTVKISKLKHQSPNKAQKGQSPNSKRKHCFVCQKKSPSPYDRNNLSQNKRLINKFEFIRKQLEKEGVDFPSRQIHEDDNSRSIEKAQRVNGFLQRMEYDRQRRIQTQARQSIQKILSKEALFEKQQPKKKQQIYRSVTPVKDSMTAKDRARYKQIKRKRQLEEMYERASFQPNVNERKPKTHKFGLGHLKDLMKENQDHVIHLASPDEIKFLLNQGK